VTRTAGSAVRRIFRTDPGQGRAVRGCSMTAVPGPGDVRTTGGGSTMTAPSGAPRPDAARCLCLIAAAGQGRPARPPSSPVRPPTRAPAVISRLVPDRGRAGPAHGVAIPSRLACHCSSKLIRPSGETGQKPQSSLPRPIVGPTSVIGPGDEACPDCSSPIERGWSAPSRTRRCGLLSACRPRPCVGRV
jgi:hypothetical protein